MDYTNNLVCGGSTEWVEGSNQISAWMDDEFTTTIKDGFSPDEIANKMNKTEQYDLSDEDINELRRLFMDINDEELDDEEEV